MLKADLELKVRMSCERVRVAVYALSVTAAPRQREAIVDMLVEHLHRPLDAGGTSPQDVQRAFAGQYVLLPPTPTPGALARATSYVDSALQSRDSEDAGLFRAATCNFPRLAFDRVAYARAYDGFQNEIAHALTLWPEGEDPDSWREAAERMAKIAARQRQAISFGDRLQAMVKIAIDEQTEGCFSDTVPMVLRLRAKLQARIERVDACRARLKSSFISLVSRHFQQHTSDRNAVAAFAQRMANNQPFAQAEAEHTLRVAIASAQALLKLKAQYPFGETCDPRFMGIQTFLDSTDGHRRAIVEHFAAAERAREAEAACAAPVEAFDSDSESEVEAVPPAAAAGPGVCLAAVHLEEHIVAFTASPNELIYVFFNEDGQHIARIQDIMTGVIAEARAPVGCGNVEFKSGCAVFVSPYTSAFAALCDQGSGFASGRMLDGRHQLEGAHHIGVFGRNVVIGANNGMVELFDASQTLRSKGAFRAHKNALLGLAVGGNFFATFSEQKRGASDTEVRIWQTSAATSARLFGAGSTPASVYKAPGQVDYLVADGPHLYVHSQGEGSVVQLTVAAADPGRYTHRQWQLDSCDVTAIGASNGLVAVAAASEVDIWKAHDLSTHGGLTFGASTISGAIPASGWLTVYEQEDSRLAAYRL